MDEINLEHCLTDKVFNKILKDERGEYEFDKEGLKAKKDKVKILLEEKITLNSRIIEGNDEYIKDMTTFQLQFLSGLVVSEQEDFEAQFND